MTEQGPAIADRIPIFALFGANAISQVGNTVLIVAGPWFVLEITGSAARVGLVAAAIGVGAVVPVVLGGPLVDRLGFKRASVLTDLAAPQRWPPYRCFTWQVSSLSGNSSCSCSCSRASTQTGTRPDFP